MTPIELLKEIEAWLCFNTTPNAENTAALRTSIKECLDNFEAKEKNSFTIEDMEKAFLAGSDKRNWTQVKLTGVISGNDFSLEPVFKNWFNKKK